LFEFSILLVYLPTPGVENPGTFNNSKPYNEIYVVPNYPWCMTANSIEHRKIRDKSILVE